ncbi:iron complex transport system permease protein [Flavimobilis soli]|uniref:Iron complex transport system permease protein n=1 Tax=Flavimobilis soli TaxID=442709 RepID=A0A2A9EFC8_9MICO|nr:iron chelate uptake ABC transporter family permease subunit [Flavimobilis soli]PFG36930.1 iron complex transport system permease protein [Flavimobilis soli]
MSTTLARTAGPPDAAATPARRRPGALGLTVAVALTAILLVASLLTGAYDVVGADDGAWMFALTRVPRTAALVLAGAAMAVSGLVMQMLTQNRFVEPTTTGTTEWAGLGLLAVTIVAPTATIATRMGVAIVTSFVGTMIFFLILRRLTLTSSLVVPIVGIMLGAVVGAVSSYLALATDTLQNLSVWFAGSFTSVFRGQYEPLWIVAGVVAVIVVVADRFTVAGLGKDVATNVGVSYERVVLLGAALVAVATGVVTVVVGNLPFVGLVVPNVVALLRGDDLRSNLPWVCVLGVGLVTACDLVGRIVIAPFEVPVSLVLGIVGAVVFIAMILRGRRRG